MTFGSLPSGLRLVFLVASTGMLAAQTTGLTITTTSLPVGLIGQAYTFALSATGGTAPYTWSADTIPGGFSISANGMITGTPTTTGVFTVIARVTDRVLATATKQLTITFNSSSVTIRTASPLPPGTTGTPYSQTFAASGGLPPYTWASGALPAGLLLNAATGVLSGTPTGKGSFTFTVQAADSAGNTTTKSFALTITTPPLTITTDTLFSGTLGLPYSQSLVASGGVPPYKYSILSGQLAAGIILDAAAGTLAGTPQAAGSFSITVQVTDSAGTTASRDLTLTVSAPKLTIVTGSPLPNGTVGTAYSQTLSAIGGSAPYSWSLSSGSLPGLNVTAAGVLSGTPTDSGSFNFTIGVKDSAGQTGTKSFALTINPGPLTITTATQLPGATLGQAFSQTLAATGGAQPYTWSATGLPDGLSLDSATGIISGAPTAGGSFSFAVTVTDNARATSTTRLQLSISMPALPTLTITGLSDTANPTDQPKVQLTLASPYPATISGQLSLTFTSDVGGGDGTIQFATGSRTASFTIPAGSTSSTTALAIQTGTVAGTIKITAQNITAPGQPGPIDITPTPAPGQSTRIRQAAPSLTSARLIRSANGFSIQVVGYTTSREITQAAFHFTAASGSTLQTGDVTIPVQPIFSQWFQDPASVSYGSQFVFTQQFTVQGDPNAVIPATVILTNSIGGSNAVNITP